MNDPIHLTLAILLSLLTSFNTLGQSPSPSNDQLVTDTCQANNLIVEAELLAASSQFQNAVDQLKSSLCNLSITCALGTKCFPAHPGSKIRRQY